MCSVALPRRTVVARARVVVRHQLSLAHVHTTLGHSQVQVVTITGGTVHVLADQHSLLTGREAVEGGNVAGLCE